MASKFRSLLNTHSPALRDSLYDTLQSSVSTSQLQDVVVTCEDVIKAIHRVKSGKFDSDGLSSEHLRFACPVIADSLASLFTACLRHGYMPKGIRDCILIPVPKDNSCSENYRPIALASTLSKVVEHIILTKYEHFLCTNPLQLGFKSGSSTTLCTSLIKLIVSRYMNHGSKVFGCFLDASKAFDRVDHGLLFQKLQSRGLPSPILRFLISWYRMQRLQVQWNQNYFSDSFSVSNGVRQGSVLSPVLFAIYLDGLLDELSDSGVGCYWRWLFAGAFCYADDVVLLAPCASALRIMLTICDTYAKSHGLLFNTAKTQLICFRSSTEFVCNDKIFFGNTCLDFSNSVTHLGHRISHNLKDKEDILRAIKDLNRKANSVLYTFSFIDIFTLCFLIKTYCLSLYGCTLWSLSSASLKLLQTSINKVFRRVWCLPRCSHTSIVLSIANMDFVHNCIQKRFNKFLSSCLASKVLLVKLIFSDCSQLAYTPVGYNVMYGQSHAKFFSVYAADIIRSYRLYYGFLSPFEDYISFLSSS